MYHLQKKKLVYMMMFGLLPQRIIENTIPLPLRHESFFQDGYMQERQIISIVSNGMKGQEQTVCNYHRRLDGTGQNPDVVQVSVNKRVAFTYLLSESNLLISAYEKQWYWEEFSCNYCSVVWS